jgi:hypothetical protein
MRAERRRVPSERLAQFAGGRRPPIGRSAERSRDGVSVSTKLDGYRITWIPGPVKPLRGYWQVTTAAGRLIGGYPTYAAAARAAREHMQADPGPTD